MPLVKAENVLVSEEMASHAEQGGRAARGEEEGAEAPPSQLSNGKTMSEFQHLNKYVPYDLNPVGTKTIQSQIKIVNPLHW